MERRRLSSSAANGGVYFPNGRTPPPCVLSGCALLDCTLGGGWAIGKISNIVGDKSAGKTLLAIEACANFHRQYPKGKIFYRESEGAFDLEYARDLGLPEDAVDFGPDGIDTLWDSVEAVFKDLDSKLASARRGQPMLYIVDSLDALSDETELGRAFDADSFGTSKASKISQMFRRLIRRIRQAGAALIIISQIRDNIGVKFGEKHKRAGGHALDFYASQVLWLYHVKTVVDTISGVKRATAVHIRARCKKNKIAPPFRECEFTIQFGFGIDDVEASVQWLGEVKMLKKLGFTQSADSLMDAADKDAELRGKIREAVIASWSEVESRFRPTRRKYE